MDDVLNWLNHYFSETDHTERVGLARIIARHRNNPMRLTELAKHMNTDCQIMTAMWMSEHI